MDLSLSVIEEEEYYDPRDGGKYKEKGVMNLNEIEMLLKNQNI